MCDQRVILPASGSVEGGAGELTSEETITLAMSSGENFHTYDNFFLIEQSESMISNIVTGSDGASGSFAIPHSVTQPTYAGRRMSSQPRHVHTQSS